MKELYCALHGTFRFLTLGSISKIGQPREVYSLTMGTMDTMSAQGSDQEEAECWEEASSRALPRLDLSEWTEEVGSLDDSSRLRWSIGIGKKDNWEGRAKGVSLTPCSHGA